MDPLVKIKEARERGVIPEGVYSLILDRFPIAISGINRIEKASGIQFPVAYVNPSVTVTSPDPYSYQYGILFARTIPLIHEGVLRVVIQISAPLVAYGLKGTVHAVLAHEFLHYLELIRRVSKMRVLSDEVSGNLFENVYADRDRLFEPRAVFNDRTLLLHITKRFPSGFRDYRLEDKAVKLWVEKGLPKDSVSLDANVAKIPASSLARAGLDDVLLGKIAQLESKSARIRRRRLY